VFVPYLGGIEMKRNNTENFDKVEFVPYLGGIEIC